MNKLVWIDTDAGFDDFAAIAMVTQAAHLDIVGCSLVAGNAPIDVVTTNMQRMAAFMGWRFPLHLGSARPLIGAIITAQAILGDDALGGADLLPLMDSPPTVHKHGVMALISALENTQAPLEILALGPLTNIAIALSVRPDLVGHIGAITWMGGSTTTGNHTAAAEFNALCDPTAVAITLATGAAFRMVGLNCCRQVQVSLDDVGHLQRAGANVTDALLEAYVSVATRQGRATMAVYDPCAAAALVDPASITFSPAHIAVELGNGPARGMTVVETRSHKRAPNANVAVTANSERIRALMLSALATDQGGSA